MLIVREKYSPGTCDYKDKYQEVRWDLSGCNLRCHFCWSPASRPEVTHDPAIMLNTDEIIVRTKKIIKSPPNTFIRFTGGEPTLQWKGVNKVIEVLGKSNFGRYIPILTQTNGIEIGKGNIDTEVLYKESDQPFLFELSFKGTNSHEFELLTDRDRSLFEYQVKGYELLKELSQSHKNIAVVAVLGVYHSSVKGTSKYAFVNPATGDLLFENQNDWNGDFKRVWLNASLKWVEPIRMSPKGVWENMLRRCGENGQKIIKKFHFGVATNEYSYFSAKPKSHEYAHQIINGEYWKKTQSASRTIIRRRKG